MAQWKFRVEMPGGSLAQFCSLNLAIQSKLWVEHSAKSSWGYTMYFKSISVLQLKMFYEGLDILLFFLQCVQHAIPGPRIKPVPQQWQCLILNPLSHQKLLGLGVLEACFAYTLFWTQLQCVAVEIASTLTEDRLHLPMEKDHCDVSCVPFSFKKERAGVPIMVQQKQIWLGTMRFWVQSLASLSGLRIWCYHELWCRSQTWLGSGISVAEV